MHETKWYQSICWQNIVKICNTILQWFLETAYKTHIDTVQYLVPHEPVKNFGMFSNMAADRPQCHLVEDSASSQY